ncbi:MAG TPA: phage head-tail connector protein [Verrucomicrobiae bacterium]
MLTQLSTIKARLGILDTDLQYDTLLTNAIQAASERFDRECNRQLARAEGVTQEFSADITELCAHCYPIETVSKFEVKDSESGGWVEQAGVEYLVRQRCVISLAAPLGSCRQQGRITYTGGYVLPGTPPAEGQTPLPRDLEQAAIEQVAYWFQNRDRLGLLRIWEYNGTYRHYADLDLLRSVRAVLFQYTRWDY